ncbi:hypothetical protein SBDP1_130056 [Syntrophobacter sp. SbD1]|nr:hypothetical protein SBDP1_130056 [Syntrophobacter sp. SbD1]
MERKVFDLPGHAHLEHMHKNPVRKGLVGSAEEWRHGSAGWYLVNRPVGVEIVGL